MVSIVIATHKGAEEQTNRLIRSIHRSTYQDFEIIVVNEGLERSRQRNIGIERSKGEFIFWPDSDWVLSPGLLEECVGKMKKYDSLYIPELIIGGSFFTKVRNFERQFYTGVSGIDAVRFVKRGYCPFFDESMSGPEDACFDFRVPGKKGITKAYYYHHDEVGLIRYIQKKAYYSKSMKKFAEKYPNAKVMDLKYRCFGVFVEDGKFERLICHPFMSLCVFGLLILRGIIYFLNRGENENTRNGG